MSTCFAGRSERRSGSAILTTVVLLAIAGIAVGSILTAAITYSANCQRMHYHQTAAYLADAGLRTALVKVNGYSDGNITYSQSRGYYSQTNTFTAGDWGFQTQLSVSNGQYQIASVGRYMGNLVAVQGTISLGAGSRSIHALYAHAMFAGNSGGDTNYTLQIGGTAAGADFVRGDVYSGRHIARTGDAALRLPEILNDFNGDGVCGITDTWVSAYATQVFTNPLTRAEFDAYEASMASHMNAVYNNGRFDEGEAFVDTIGNGVYDVGEPFTDSNGNGVRDLGDSFIDRNGNGVYDAGVDTVVDNGNGQYDAGEEWTEDSNPLHHNKRKNGRYDPAGGYWLKSGSTWTWTTARYKVSGVWYYPNTWPAEAFEDVGDGVYQPAEAYTDQNGIYDAGEEYLDDRNPIYDYGTQAAGSISGMPSPDAGQRAATGGDALIAPPDLARMYYAVSKTNAAPGDALDRWGNDVAVTASDYGTAKAISDVNRPEHIFVRNPPTSGSVSSAGKTIYGREYTSVYDANSNRVDDYFLEDPADTTYNSYVSGDAIDGTVYTSPMYLNVQPQDNVKLYYVEGNLYIHNPRVYSMRFRQPGTRITIVAKGNITISDEFYYNADYANGLQRADMDSTVVDNPSDALCLIALKNSNCPTNSGNIYIGDRQFGTGGSIHAMLYAENDFVDNNLNTSDQQNISVFGNMTAGNQLRINRQTGGGYYRTRLDVTLDERIRNGEVIVPGLPHAVGSQRSIVLDTAWKLVPGTWSSWSSLK